MSEGINLNDHNNDPKSSKPNLDLNSVFTFPEKEIIYIKSEKTSSHTSSDSNPPSSTEHAKKHMSEILYNNTPPTLGGSSNLPKNNEEKTFIGTNRTGFQNYAPTALTSKPKTKKDDPFQLSLKSTSLASSLPLPAKGEHSRSPQISNDSIPFSPPKSGFISFHRAPKPLSFEEPKFNTQIQDSSISEFYTTDRNNNPYITVENSESLDLENNNSDSTLNSNLFEEMEGRSREGGRLFLPSLLTFNTKNYGFNDEYQALMSRVKNVENPPLYDENKGLYDKIGYLASRFRSTSLLYAKLIIRERHFPISEKTIKPITNLGIAGGEKFIQEGILFKFAVDNYDIYGGDSNAMKVAKLELRHTEKLMKLAHPEVDLPLSMVIDYRGMRLVATTLLPLTADSLRYGSSDGGKNFFNGSPETKKMASELGKKLNLLPHETTQKGKVTCLSTDIEFHIGDDERIYVIDTARLMPPEPPLPNLKGSFLFRQMRFELLESLNEPLSADSFSRFQSADVKANQYNSKTTLAWKNHFANFKKIAKELESEFEYFIGPLDKFKLVDWLHSKGINCRHMGSLWCCTKNPLVKTLLMDEMIIRTAKSILRCLLRNSAPILGAHDAPFIRIAIEYFNLVFSKSPRSINYWKTDFGPSLILSFFSRSENFPTDYLSLRNDNTLQYVFEKLVKVSGIKLSQSFYNSVEWSRIFKNGSQILDETDIDEFYPVANFSPLINAGLAITKFLKLHRVKQEEKLQKKLLGSCLSWLEKSPLVPHFQGPFFFRLWSKLLHVGYDTNWPSFEHIIKSFRNFYFSENELFKKNRTFTYLFSSLMSFGNEIIDALCKHESLKFDDGFFEEYFCTLYLSPQMGIAPLDCHPNFLANLYRPDLFETLQDTLNQNLWKKIEQISIQIPLPIHSLLLFLKKVPNIIDFELGPFVKNEHIESISYHLGKNLKSLGIFSSFCDESMLIRIVEKCPKLQSFKWKDYNLSGIIVHRPNPINCNKITNQKIFKNLSFSGNVRFDLSQLKDPKALESLKISNIFREEKFSLKGIQKCSNLTKLELDVLLEENWINNIKSITNLVELNLSSIQALDLETILPSFIHLKILKIQFQKGSKNLFNFDKSKCSLIQLKVLEISEGVSSLFRMITQFKDLEILKLTHLSSSTKDDIENFLKSLYSLKNLKEIFLQRISSDSHQKDLPVQNLLNLFKLAKLEKIDIDLGHYISPQDGDALNQVQNIPTKERFSFIRFCCPPDILLKLLSLFPKLSTILRPNCCKTEYFSLDAMKNFFINPRIYVSHFDDPNSLFSAFRTGPYVYYLKSKEYQIASFIRIFGGIDYLLKQPCSLLLCDQWYYNSSKLCERQSRNMNN